MKAIRFVRSFGYCSAALACGLVGSLCAVAAWPLVQGAKLAQTVGVACLMRDKTGSWK